MDLHDKIGPLSYQELCCRISLTQIIEQAHIVSYPYYVMLLLQVHTVLGVAGTKFGKGQVLGNYVRGGNSDGSSSYLRQGVERLV